MAHFLGEANEAFPPGAFGLRMVAWPMGGVRVEVRGRLPSGEPRSAILKAWAPIAHLPWELKRFKAAAGYAETTNFQVNDLVKQQLPQWRQWMQHSGLHVPDHYGGSRSSLARSAADIAAAMDCEQEYWLSTAGMLGVLMFWAIKRKEVGLKQLAVSLAKWFLDKTFACSAEVDTTIAPVDILHLCSKGRAENRCSCVQKYLAADRQRHAPYYSRMCRDLLLMSQCRRCLVLAKLFGRTLLELAEVVDDQVEQWGDMTWQRTAAARLDGGKKRQRIDPHLREWVVRRSLQDGAFGNVVESSKALCKLTSASSLVERKAREMSAMRSALHLSFDGVRAMSFIFDGIRFGNPSKEYLVAAASDLHRNRHAVVPPQADQC